MLCLSCSLSDHLTFPDFDLSSGPHDITLASSHLELRHLPVLSHFIRQVNLLKLIVIFHINQLVICYPLHGELILLQLQRFVASSIVNDQFEAFKFFENGSYLVTETAHVSRGTHNVSCRAEALDMAVSYNFGVLWLSEGG